MAATAPTPTEIAQQSDWLGLELDLGLGHRYRIDGLLCRATFGDIWCATWLQTGAPMALKTMRRDLPAAVQAGHRQALQAEAEHLRRLPSRHVVRCQKAGHWQGQPVLVLERLHCSLKDHLAQWARYSRQAASSAATLPDGQCASTGQGATAQPPGAVAHDQALGWVREAARALAALHRSGRKHLDLKPANLLLSAPGTHGRQALKLADFGVCLPLAVERHPFVGTPGWASPEQCTPVGRNAAGQALFATSQASDWYTLGELLHRLLTGALSPNGQARLRRYQTSGWHGLTGFGPGAASACSFAADDQPTWAAHQPAALGGAAHSTLPSRGGHGRSEAPAQAPLAALCVPCPAATRALLADLLSEQPSQRLRGAVALLG